jgi:antitoxin (DNA-binding transcriptional repressor) of toxin-antitoxin stability system
MKTVSIKIAKRILPQLLARVEAGEEIVLVGGKNPIAKVVPLKSLKRRRQFGALRGKITVGLEFFRPLPKQELESWE